MRINIIFFLLFLLLNSLPVNAQSLAEKRILQPAAMQEDFNYLRKMLETTHPGLYKHHSREAMQYKMDSLGRQLTAPLAFIEFYKKIAYLIAEVRCEHTYCNYGQGFDKLLKSAKVLPLQLHFMAGRAYVVVNCTDDTDIQLGDELLTINQHPIDSILKVLYQYLPADGYMLSSKEQEMSGMKFNIWYYLFIGQPAIYEVTLRNKAGQLVEKKWKKPPTIQECNKLAVKNPVNKKILETSKANQEKLKQPLRLELMPGKNTAVLTVQSFSVDKEGFILKMSNFFDTLSTQKISNLLIDVSFNGGGEEELAAELVSYFISQPTRFIEREYLLTDSDAHFAISNIPDDARKNKYEFISPLSDGISEVKISKYSQELKTMQPKPNRFKGKVFIYVNGKTSSAASTFAAVMKSNALATIVGEETAGSYTGGGTVIGLDLKLPNSTITAHTSIVYQVFATSGADGNRGVLPDYPYMPSLDELINGNTSWRDYIIDIISRNKNGL